MTSFEPLGVADLCRNVRCSRQCRTGRHVNPDKSLTVRKSEVAPAKGRGCIDMEAAIIVGRFHPCSLFCSNGVVPRTRRIAARQDA